jgi:hypothetical protein
MSQLVGVADSIGTLGAPVRSKTWAQRTQIARWTPLVVPPLLYATAAAAQFSRFLADPTRGVPGGADGVIYTWYFEWVKQAVVHLHNPFFAPALNAPAGVNVMWNTAMFALALVFLPLTALVGAGPTVGSLMVLAPVASASTAYFVFRRLTGRTLGSALAAALYGFGPFFVSQNGHLHLTFAVYPPLVLLLGHELFVTQRASARRVGVWLGVATGLQLLISEEIVVLTVLVAVSSVITLAALHPRQVRERVRYSVTGVGIAAGTAAVIAAVPLGYQFFGPQALSHGVPATGQRLDLAGIVRPSAAMRFASRADAAANRTFPANGVENTGYLGWALVIVLLASCAWLVVRRERFGWWWLLTTLGAIALSLGSPVVGNGLRLGPGPWALLRRVPLLDGTVVVRFTLITTLLAALMLAWGLARLRGWALAAGLAFVVAALVPLLPANRYNGILHIATPRFFTTSAVDEIPRGAPVFVLPYGPQAVAQASVMTWQVDAGLRFDLIGGYSVIDNHGGMAYTSSMPSFARLLMQVGDTGTPPATSAVQAARGSISPSGLRFVVITDEQAHRSVVVATAARLTGCRPRRSVDVTLCAVR